MNIKIDVVTIIRNSTSIYTNDDDDDTNTNDDTSNDSTSIYIETNIRPALIAVLVPINR